MKLFDYLAVFFILIMGISGILYSVSAPAGKSVLITTPEGEYRYSLEKDNIIKLHSLSGPFWVEIKSGKVRVIETACPHQICKQRGWAYRSGDSIACVPNRILIKIESGEREVDGITE